MGGITWSRDASDALLLDARAAVTDGDIARALESIRAVNGLADHLSKTAASPMVSVLVAMQMRLDMQRYALSELLPSAGNVNLSEWQSALNPRLRTPTQMADTLRYEWNFSMPTHILPVLSDSVDPGTPRDAEYLAETYTRHIQTMIQQAESMPVGQYAAAENIETPTNHLSKRSRDLELVNAWDPRTSFLRHEEATGLVLAAFALLNGQSMPLDPVYGQPYKWDPVKRELSVPEGPNRNYTKLKPIKLQK